MSKKHSVIGLALAAVLLVGCKTYPLGFSEAEWNNLTPTQQLEARKQQSALDAKKRQAKAEEKAREAEAEKQRQELVKLRRQNAQYGDLVQCVLKNAVLDFKPGWKDLQQTPFSLVKSEKKQLKVFSKRRDKSTILWAELDEAAMNITFCRFKPTSDYTKRKYCTDVAATSKQLHRGISKNFQIKDYMQGRLYCSLAPTQNGGFGTQQQTQKKDTIDKLLDKLFD